MCVTENAREMTGDVHAHSDAAIGLPGQSHRVIARAPRLTDGIAGDPWVQAI